MKSFHLFNNLRSRLGLCCLVGSLSLISVVVAAQTCPATISTTPISTFPNTYFSANQSDLLAGGKNITIGPAGYGSTPITSGDILLIIQMQGAEINASNGVNYGNSTGIGTGYLSNGNLMAGYMEYAVAATSVPITGGSLTLKNGVTHSYHNSQYPSAGDGQYSFQILRVPVYYRAKLTANITVPTWNGHTGGVMVMYATDSIIMNGDTINAVGSGFRGGAGRQLSGGVGSNADYITLSTNNANGSKGEGIAGTPRFTIYNNALVDSGSSLEGYPSGSYAEGAPANAGGGGTDGNPSGNTDNCGGGGGGNGGNGGNGGKSWSSNLAIGGRGGIAFTQVSASRLVMGGGGGAGTTNNGTGNPGGGLASSGAAGGGIVILMANTISGTGVILATGGNANSTVTNDGSGGGGGGGSVIVYSATGNLTNLTVNAKGGNGGSNTGGGAAHGPGGGGGGGVIYSNSALNASSSTSGGFNGSTAGSPSAYGSLSGTLGSSHQNMTQAQMATFPLNCAILPMSFVSVEAKNQSGNIAVQWSVANEAGTSEYLIERSADGNTFMAIGSVACQPKSSVSFSQYSYNDQNALPASGTLYYRVKAIGMSGQIIYSWVVTAKMNAVAGGLSVYPNPVNATTLVSFAAAAQGEVSLKVYDLSGNLFWQKAYQANAGMNSVQVDAFRTVPNGVYMLEVSDGQAPVSTKIMVRH
ncbi:MAG: T9SS type A sorting domain-containing protein [Bacteroidota bacterium]|nr:T9SS type A sorting domain-containing protein [Bacteroidota bacterium]